VINGIRICKPTGSPAFAVAGSGSQTAAIVGQGSVEFANATSLSLNGVFTSQFDNYMIVTRFISSNNNRRRVGVRFRLAGSDNSTANSYVSQLLFVPTAGGDGTVIGASRVTSNLGTFYRDETDSLAQGVTSFVYGPALAQPTAWRSVQVIASSGAGIEDPGGTHNVSTAYDGFTIIAEAGSWSGLVSVYGLVN
jgi:hypothetical protein